MALLEALKGKSGCLTLTREMRDYHPNPHKNGVCWGPRHWVRDDTHCYNHAKKRRIGHHRRVHPSSFPAMTPHHTDMNPVTTLRVTFREAMRISPS